MEKLVALFYRKVERTDMTFKRYLYEKINWDNRLIVIKGAKGVGKTTLILQHIKQTFPDMKKALYVSLDNIWFITHNLTDLTEYFYTHGGTHLFLDEVHKYKNWLQEVKNIYDNYPDLHIVVTGSSMLRIEQSSMGDLSRRHRMYTLVGLSLREYLSLEGVVQFPVLSLEEICENHSAIAARLTSNVKVLPHFEKYIKSGYYPFYREEGDGYAERVQQVIDTIVESEIPAVSNIEYNSIYKIKHLLAILSEEKPYTLNISSLCKDLQSTRNNVLKLLDLLDKAAIIRKIYATSSGMSSLVKPEKILFDNTNIIHSLSFGNIGTERETFFASQLSQAHTIALPDKGDFLIDDKLLFEVGGKNKNFKQIRDITHSYVVSDNIEIGAGNKIPLWMFGLMY